MITPYILLMLLAFAADRFSKWWVGAYLATHGTTTINAFLTLRETHNEGIAFGLFQGTGQFVGWLTAVLLLGLLVYLWRLPQEQWLVRTGLAILIGGAAGNLWDRVTTGAVLDFIQIPLRVGIFNVADVLIYVGMFLLLAGAFWQQPARLMPQ